MALAANNSQARTHCVSHALSRFRRHGTDIFSLPRRIHTAHEREELRGVGKPGLHRFWRLPLPPGSAGTRFGLCIQLRRPICNVRCAHLRIPSVIASWIRIATPVVPPSRFVSCDYSSS
jgi:hypothetical protein